MSRKTLRKILPALTLKGDLQLRISAVAIGILDETGPAGNAESLLGRINQRFGSNAREYFDRFLQIVEQDSKGLEERVGSFLQLHFNSFLEKKEEPNLWDISEFIYKF